MGFDAVSYLMGKASGGGGGVQPVSGSVTTATTLWGLTIPAPNGVDFSQYNHIVVWCVSDHAVWATETHMYSVFIGLVQSTYTTFSADSISLSGDPDAGKQFSAATYNYVVWHE